MSLGKLIYTEEFVRDGKHYHRSVFAPLMVRVNSDGLRGSVPMPE
jgi:hypothetical protein